jgi:hypothetical protein
LTDVAVNTISADLVNTISIDPAILWALLGWACPQAGELSKIRGSHWFAPIHIIAPPTLAEFTDMPGDVAG